MSYHLPTALFEIAEVVEVTALRVTHEKARIRSILFFQFYFRKPRDCRNNYRHAYLKIYTDSRSSTDGFVPY